MGLNNSPFIAMIRKKELLMKFKRRRIGAAYELCPAEKFGLWAQRNLLVLIGGGIGVGLWFGLVIFAAKMLGWLGENNAVVGGGGFDDNSATGMAIKVIGGLVVFILIVTRQSK